MLHQAITRLRCLLAEMKEAGEDVSSDIYSGLHVNEGVRREELIAELLLQALDNQMVGDGMAPPSRKETLLAVEFAHTLGPDYCQRLYHVVVAATRLTGSKPKGGK